MEFLRNKRSSFAFIQVLICAVLLWETAWPAAGQEGPGKTVIQKATEQFESSPLTTTPLDQGIWMFSGDGGNVKAITAEGSTLLIDGGIESRVSKLNAAVSAVNGGVKDVCIVSGQRAGVLADLLAGQVPGTRLSALSRSGLEVAQ